MCQCPSLVSRPEENRVHQAQQQQPQARVRFGSFASATTQQRHLRGLVVATTRSSTAGGCAVVTYCASSLGKVQGCDDANCYGLAFVAQHEAAELREVLECFDADALCGFEADQARLQGTN
jgi:hypothetical protein